MILRSNGALIGWIAVILIVTLTPTHAKHEVHLRPLQDIAAAFGAPLNLPRALGVLGNVLLFVPLGIVLAARGLAVRQAVAAGAAISIAIEIAQLLVPGRTTSVDDVLLNTLGAALGYNAGRRAGPPRPVPRTKGPT